jgi:hypothetical protein
MHETITLSKMVQVLEFQQGIATLSEPMAKYQAQDYLIRKYREQPLNYFNQDRTIWIVDVSDKTIRAASLKIEV